MSIFSSKKEVFFSKPQEKLIVAAIKQAELNTSGEIRVHLDEEEIEEIKERAVYIFDSLGMQNTKLKNGVLLYINPVIKRFLVLGDEGIHQNVGDDFWERISQIMQEYFAKGDYTNGTVKAIEAIGIELKKYFPYQGDKDINELDDEISY